MLTEYDDAFASRSGPRVIDVLDQKRLAATPSSIACHGTCSFSDGSSKRVTCKEMVDALGHTVWTFTPDLTSGRAATRPCHGLSPHGASAKSAIGAGGRGPDWTATTPTGGVQPTVNARMPQTARSSGKLRADHEHRRHRKPLHDLAKVVEEEARRQLATAKQGREHPGQAGGQAGWR